MRRGFLFVGGAAVLAGLAWFAYGNMPVGQTAAPAAPRPDALPAEVTAFVEQRDGCDHFRGEEPYDAERAAYLRQRTEELCQGTDAALARLRQKYGDAPQVVEQLSHYEDNIEAD
jgi:hypothetical protein